MYRYNFILSLLIFISCSLAVAQTPDEKAVRFRTGAISYLSWNEFLTIENSSSVADAFANFYGTAFTYEEETYRGRKGRIFSASLITGQANGGGTQTGITYQKSNQKWLGFKADYKYAHRLSGQITFAAGPTFFYRQLTWPKDTGIEKVESGANMQLGAIAEVRYRMNPRWEIQQSFGTLFIKANTIWSLGLGYKY